MLLDRETSKKMIDNLNSLPLELEKSEDYRQSKKLFVDLIEANLYFGRFGPALEEIEKAKKSEKLRAYCPEALFSVASFYLYHGNEKAAINYFIEARKCEPKSRNIEERTRKKLAEILKEDIVPKNRVI